MHRFFLSPQMFQGNRVVIDGPTVHQIRDVLRMRPGDEIVLLDNTGWAYHAELVKVERDLVEGHVIDKQELKTEPRTRITLYQGLLKGQKFDWVLQKGTELGVAAFVPMLSSRCVVGSTDDIGTARVERWRRIIAEAAEQSGRAVLPDLTNPVEFGPACQAASRQGLALIPWEEERSTRLRQALQDERAKRVSLFIGPEGGFTEEEIAVARNVGVRPVTLGSRILRAETAGLAAATAILYELGDFG